MEVDKAIDKKTDEVAGDIVEEHMLEEYAKKDDIEDNFG